MHALTVDAANQAMFLVLILFGFLFGAVRGGAAMLKPCGEKTVAWLFTGKEDSLNASDSQGIALGSLLHMLQDSFCMAHAQREVARRANAKARLIKSFNFYNSQSYTPVVGAHTRADRLWGYDWRHSAETRVRKTAGAQEAADAGKEVIGYYRDQKPWDAVKSYLLGIFALTPALERQKPQDKQWDQGEADAGGKRISSASGRLFHQESIHAKFQADFGDRFMTQLVRFGWYLPKPLRPVRMSLRKYEGLIKKVVKSMNTAIADGFSLES